MNEQALKKLIDEAIKEAHSCGLQSGKKESSNLVFSIKDVMKERFDEISLHLEEIKAQTIKTNGRVTSLELSRSYIWGAIATILLLGGVLINLSYEKINNNIEEKIDESHKQIIHS